MNGRRPKALRREGAVKEPTMHMSFGPSRKARRQMFRIKDRSFTATGRQVRMVDMNDEVHYKKAQHIIMDHSEEHFRQPGDWPNRARMAVRKAHRDAARANNASH